MKVEPGYPKNRCLPEDGDLCIDLPEERWWVYTSVRGKDLPSHWCVIGTGWWIHKRITPGTLRVWWEAEEWA